MDLLNRIETVMEGNKQEGGGVAAKALFDYPLLLSKEAYGAKCLYDRTGTGKKTLGVEIKLPGQISYTLYL